MKRSLPAILWSVLAMLCVVPVVLLAQDSTAITEVVSAEGYLTEILVTVSAFLSSVTLGAIKKFTTLLDGKWTSLIKPIQPIIVAGMATLVPAVTQLLGVELGDPAAWANAPTVTLVLVVLRELKEYAKKNLLVRP